MSTHRKINSLKKKKDDISWKVRAPKLLFRCCLGLPYDTNPAPSKCPYEGQLQNELHFPLKYDFTITVVFTGKVCKEIATFCLQTRIYFQF